MTARRSLLALVCVAVTHTGTASAHPFTFTETELRLRANGTFQVDLTCDLDALALGAPQDTDDAELVASLEAHSPAALDDRIAQLRRLFERRIRVRFDDTPAPFDVSFPDYDTPRAAEAEIPTLLGLTARLTGTVPAGATNVEFFASRAFSDIHLTVVDETRDVTRRSILEPGARSDPFELLGPVAEPNRLAIAWQYIRLGFAHIIPDGLDHILFVLGLFLLSTELRPLVWQVTAFTLAHAVTLTLATIGTVSLPASVVEPLIALSITWVAVDNILTGRQPVRGEGAALRRMPRHVLHGLPSPWRPAIVFLFGLLHGLGFAGTLAELGLNEGERTLALVSFNAGIEAGQLAVIAAAFAALGWLDHRAGYRRWVVVPLSGTIALVGLIWAVDRVMS